MEPTFFDTSSEFRAWLEDHHANSDELFVGFHKKRSGRPSITWPEAVDQGQTDVFGGLRSLLR